MALRNIVIGMMVFSALIVGFSAFYLDLSEQYGKMPDDLSTLEITEGIRKQTEEMKATIEQTEKGTLGFVYLILVGVYQAALLPFNFIGLISTLIADTASSIGIPVPSWFVALLMTGTMIYILYEIISAFMKYKV